VIYAVNHECKWKAILHAKKHASKACNRPSDVCCSWNIDCLSCSLKTYSKIPISRTLIFSNLPITRTKSRSLSSVEHCKFTPDFSNSLIFRTYLRFPWRFEGSTVVNRGRMVIANKDAKIYVRRSSTAHNLLFCAHTLCINYVTKTFLLVYSSVSSKQQLRFVHRQGQKSEQANDKELCRI